MFVFKFRGTVPQKRYQSREVETAQMRSYRKRFPDCNRVHCHNTYLRKREKRLADARAVWVEQKAKIDAIKAAPCVDCRVSYPPYVMHFHHRDRETKAYNVSRLTGRKSWETIQAEIDKCDLLCANCHAERTHQQDHKDWGAPMKYEGTEFWARECPGSKEVTE